MTWHLGAGIAQASTQVAPDQHAAPSHTEARLVHLALLSLEGGSSELREDQRGHPHWLIRDLSHGDCPHRPHVQLQRKARNTGIRFTWLPLCTVLTQPCLTHYDPWAAGHRAPLSLGFLCRQECCSGLAFLFSGDLPGPGIKPMSHTSPAAPGRFFATEPPAKPGLSSEGPRSGSRSAAEATSVHSPHECRGRGCRWKAGVWSGGPPLFGSASHSS